MIKKFASLLLGVLSPTQPANAQADRTVAGDTDKWMVFERTTASGLPLIVTARTGNPEVEARLKGGLATVVQCWADANTVNDRSMPQNTQRFYEIEDRLANESALISAGAFHVASVTGEGQRRTFYAHKKPIDFGQLIKNVRVEGFTCSASNVADRQVLLDLITPTVLEIQLNGDQAVIARLRENGDEGIQPRKTDFWFYGPRKALASLVSILQQRGFVIDHWLDEPGGVVLSREMAVDFATFQSTTPVLLDAAHKSGVQYDGWETFVVKDAATISGPTSSSH